MGFNNGYDSGYCDAKTEFAAEKAALEKRIAELEAGGGSGGGSGGGEPAPARDPQLVRRYLFVKDENDEAIIRDAFGVESDDNAIVITEDGGSPFISNIPIGGDEYPLVTVPIDALLATMSSGDCAVFAALDLAVVSAMEVEQVFLKFTAGGQSVSWAEADASLPSGAPSDSYGVYGADQIMLAVLKTPTGASVTIMYA